MQYLLDTNAVISLLNEREGPVRRQLSTLRPSDVGISSIVAHELYFGAYKSQRRDQNLATVDDLRFEIVPFDREDARHAGEIRAGLSAQGLPIGGYDVLIAGQARARDLTLVTRNVGEFERVEGLRIENWVEPASD